MEKKKQFTLTPGVDFVTILIVLFFALLTIGVFIWFKHRLSEIDSEIKHSSLTHVRIEQVEETVPV